MTEQDTDKMRKLYQVIKHTGKRKQSQKSVENRVRNDIMTPYWGSVFFAFFAQGATMIQENVV